MSTVFNPIREYQDGRRSVLFPGERDPLGELSEDLDRWAKDFDVLVDQFEAYREAYHALRAYTNLNDGKNARRIRAAKEKLKELRLK
jgi:hypothetical protein